jgi:hypothetical protein
VHGEQHILNRVLNVIGIPDVSCRKRTKIRGYVLEQPTIGFLVAGLRAGHGDGPVQFAVSAAGNRRGLTDRGERWWGMRKFCGPDDRLSRRKSLPGT